ncbi:hypothetical protein HZH68_009857 [Vespula germanica]|uniref:Uncharacterized protein n=1 Tax=Vespula germanica TaxID=30212 RepID=A0A834N4C4_VESGE|nr:hypothetical protein HZH68_009857 [Vespula germanica]
MEGEHRLYRAIDNLVELDYINPPSQIHTEAPNERSTEEHLGKLMAKSSIIICRGRHGGHVREISRKARRRSIYLTATYGAHPEARPTKIPAACSSIHIDEELRVRDYGVGVQAIKDVPRTTRCGPTAQEGRGESRGRRSQRTVKDDVWPDPLPLNFFASLCKKLTDTLHRSNSENYAEVFETQGRQLTTSESVAYAISECERGDRTVVSLSTRKDKATRG